MGAVIPFAPRPAPTPQCVEVSPEPLAPEPLAYRCDCGTSSFHVFPDGHIECAWCWATPVDPEKGVVRAHHPERVSLQSGPPAPGQRGPT